MDIDFVELEHRQDVLKLMEICGVDLGEAYQLYANANYNFEAAVNAHFNPVPPSPPPAQQPPLSADFPQAPYLPEEDHDSRYETYKKFLRSGQNFENRYPVRRKEGFFKSLIPKFFKGEEEEPFLQDLENILGRRVNLKLVQGSLSEALEQSWKEKFPLAILCFDFQPESRSLLQRLFLDSLLVEKILGEQFFLAGLNIATYEMEPQLQRFFMRERDSNSIIITRVNFLDEIQVMGRIRVSENTEDMKKKVKLIKSECIQADMEESHYARQYSEERKGNYHYQRPRTIKENIKLKEDREIRRQQEEEFFKSCQPKAPPPHHHSKPAEKPGKVEPPKKEEPSPQQIAAQREAKRARLAVYSSGIGFKLRLPSGQNIVVQVDEKEPVQYLFDFIDSHPEDLGFENENHRNFDISMGFGATNSLRGKEKEPLGSLFSDSEVLIVREL